MKYVAFNAVDCEYEDFKTIEEAREYLEEIFLDPSEGYHPKLDSCKIYRLCEEVGHDVIANKDDFTDEEWEEEGHSSDHDEIWKHKFLTLPS